MNLSDHMTLILQTKSVLLSKHFVRPSDRWSHHMTVLLFPKSNPPCNKLVRPHDFVFADKGVL